MENYKKFHELCQKPIGEITSEELSFLFGLNINASNRQYQGDIAAIRNYSIANIDIGKVTSENQNMSPTQGLLLGRIIAAKRSIRENKVIVLIGDSCSGKSHILGLIDKIKRMDSSEIDEEGMRKIEIDLSNRNFSAEELKDFADSIGIVVKKSDRPIRSGKANEPDIEAGVPTDEVMSCDYTYMKHGNNYGFSKADIDNMLENSHAAVIIKDMKVVKDLYRIYGNRLLPIYVHRTTNKEEWENIARQSGRTKKEIATRSNDLGKDVNTIYGELISSGIGSPQVIINQESAHLPNDALLVQLMCIIEGSYNRRIEHVRDN